MRSVLGSRMLTVLQNPSKRSISLAAAFGSTQLGRAAAIARCASPSLSPLWPARLSTEATSFSVPSPKLAQVKQSGIRVIWELAHKLERENGRDDVSDAKEQDKKEKTESRRILHLEVGQPDFPAPEPVLSATSAALRDPTYQAYISNSGLLRLREAIADSTREFAADIIAEDIGPENVVVCHGAVGAISSALKAILEPGDEVLIPDPAWSNYEMMVQLEGATVVKYPLEQAQGWKPDPQKVASLCSPKTKVLLICSPSNPTGSVLTKSELEALAAIAHERNLVIISDEIYSRVLHDDIDVDSNDRDEVEGEGALSEGSPQHRHRHQKRSASLLQVPFLDKSRVVVVDGVSKAYAMTGFRVGWIVTPNRALADAMPKVLEASVSCGVPFAQAGALAALSDPASQAASVKMAHEYRKRRDVAVAVLREFGLYAYTPAGAFYILVKACPAEADDLEFCKKLLVDQGVAVSPGSAFGNVARGYVRVSLASEISDVEEGMRRLCRYVGRKNTTEFSTY
mmetsp:Transcript_288/g.419  ORF Transcript_288/g.419 Transcript_288/m.419 type:complete len:514 (+) Transcript_288:1-1542(+)